eukprot:1129734-Pyramimonas_sp.AAC.1
MSIECPKRRVVNTSKQLAPRPGGILQRVRLDSGRRVVSAKYVFREVYKYQNYILVCTTHSIVPIHPSGPAVSNLWGPIATQHHGDLAFLSSRAYKRPRLTKC